MTKTKYKNAACFHDKQYHFCVTKQTSLKISLYIKQFYLDQNSRCVWNWKQEAHEPWFALLSEKVIAYLGAYAMQHSFSIATATWIQIWQCLKMVIGHPRTVICTKTLSPKCYMPRFSFKANLLLEKKVFKCFYHIWTWRPSCSTVRNHSNKLSIHIPQKALCEIWCK